MHASRITWRIEQTPSRVRFFVFGTPVPQQRAKTRMVPCEKMPTGWAAVKYDPKRCKDWKAVVADYASPLAPAEPWEAVVLDTLFLLPRPKRLRNRTELHTKLPDDDNLRKGVKDALKGIFYPDDKHVIGGTSFKTYAPMDLGPGVLVDVKRVTELPAKIGVQLRDLGGIRPIRALFLRTKSPYRKNRGQK